MQRGFLLNVVIGQGTAILQLLSSKDKALLVRRDAFFFLNFLLDGLYTVARFDLERDGFPSQRFYEYLHIGYFFL